ncbi:MAG: HIT domain-containing protein [Gammaproteobacteria bacterium]|nr:HIT domain-containing protein [Gammaproteobacteria bacterium]
MSYDPDNVFARILRGELPAHVVEETEHTLTFMDVMPRADGHALVIPKEHASNIHEISNESVQYVIKQVKRVASAAQQVFPDQGIRVVQLNGSEAGQSVFHLHFHVIPSSDGVNFGFHGHASADADSLAKHAARLKAALSGIK